VKYCAAISATAELLLIVQTYLLTAVLSLTVDKDVAIWKGLILVLSLFIAQVLLGASFAVATTLGQVSGLYYITLSMSKLSQTAKV